MADDDLPRGSCVITACPRDPYRRQDGSVPLVCGPHVSQLRSWLGDIPDYCDQLAEQSSPGEVEVVDEERRWPVRLDGGEWMTAVERVRVASLPGALTPGRARGGRVSGTAEAPVPIDLDAVDLLAPLRPAAAGVARRGDWWQAPGGDPDQIGHLPVAMELDGYVEALRDHRNRGEGRPDPDTAVLCRWLLDRLDEACDDWPVIDEFFAKVRELWAVLRVELGLYDGPEYKKSAPCPKCGLLALLRQPGSDFVTCGGCPAYLSIPEYEEYVKTMSVAAMLEKKRQTVEWRLFLRLRRELLATGWQWTSEKQGVHGSDEVWTVHTWARGDEAVQVWCMPGRRPDVRFNLSEETEGWIGSAWIAANGGTKRLHTLASAAGVLSVPKEQP